MAERARRGLFVELRGAPRIPIRERVEFRSARVKGYGLALDVSTGGIFVRGDRCSATPGSILYVEFSLPGDPPLARRRARGEVAWVVPGEGSCGFGVRFLELRGSDRVAIESLARARAGQACQELS